MCFLSLTTVGHGETVRHFQIVDVRRQSEFRSAKLNHSYPKRAVLLVRAPRKESPWRRQHITNYTRDTNVPRDKKTFAKPNFFSSSSSSSPSFSHFTHSVFAFPPKWELMDIHVYRDTYRSGHWASLRARIPIKPAGPKRINSLSCPCPRAVGVHIHQRGRRALVYSSFLSGRC